VKIFFFRCRPACIGMARTRGPEKASCGCVLGNACLVVHARRLHAWQCLVELKLCQSRYITVARTPPCTPSSLVLSALVTAPFVLQGKEKTHMNIVVIGHVDSGECWALDGVV